MSREIIKGHEVEYNFFDDENREMDDMDIDHVGELLEKGYVEGELNQFNHEFEDEIRGYWKKL